MKTHRLSPTLAGIALAGGCSVYLLARPSSVFAVATPANFPAWSAALPSFLHTLAFALLCAAVLRSGGVKAWYGAALWGTCALLLEVAQHGGGSTLFARGTFDWFDIAAIGGATTLAAAIATKAVQKP